jgi:hypothetical protein
MRLETSSGRSNSSDITLDDFVVEKAENPTVLIAALKRAAPTSYPRFVAEASALSNTPFAAISNLKSSV